MIAGSVNSFREPIVSLTLLGDSGQRLETQAVIDTGFNGTLTLPPAIIRQLNLPFRRRGRAFLADGSESLFDVYEAVVLWDGVQRRVPVDEADTDPLIGMAMLYGSQLTISVIDGGDVLIERLP